jgi:hypothetical protein
MQWWKRPWGAQFLLRVIRALYNEGLLQDGYKNTIFGHAQWKSLLSAAVSENGVLGLVQE